MKDAWSDQPINLSQRPDWGSLRGRLGELLSLTLAMLTISFASLVVCALCGLREHATLAALGIAIYVSGKHFGHLGREIAALRGEVALSRTEPGGRSLPMDNDACGDDRPEWQVDDLVPERRANSAMTR
jgi:hypothetical protein